MVETLPYDKEGFRMVGESYSIPSSNIVLKMA